MPNVYPLNQSPFFQLHSRKKLAELLNVSLPELEYLASAGSAEYRLWEKKFPNGKKRWIEWPKKRLSRVVVKINRFLCRIEFPAYLHSGIKGRSYLTNASVHDSLAPVAKIDLRKFFPSASYKFVYKAFLNRFNCSPDVGAILTKLVTIDGHIPTGGPASAIVSFYAYMPMFDEIFELANKNKLTMSLCVDDMTFSGEGATSNFLYKVRNIVNYYGLRVHKRHTFSGRQTKIVTGIAITNNGIRLPNKRRLKLHQAMDALEQPMSDFERRKLVNIALGRAAEAVTVEPQTFGAMFSFFLQKIRTQNQILTPPLPAALRPRSG
jgi:hypothetical protein